MTTLPIFIKKVNAYILGITGGVVGLDDLVDYADGELSLSEMWEDELTPRQAAMKLLEANGFPLN